MTIALAIKANDGIVVAADTLEGTGYAGYLKTSRSKLLTVFSEVGASESDSAAQGVCVISGAGDAGYVDSLTEEFADLFLDNKALSGKNLQRAFGKKLKEFHKEHVIPFAPPDRPTVEMLLAIQRSFQLQMLVTSRSTVRRVFPWGAIGAGSTFAEILLGRFWKPASAEAIEILAAYILFQVKECVEGCGKYTSIVTIYGPKIVDVDVAGVASSRLELPKPAVKHMYWLDIEELEKAFKGKWAGSESGWLWGLIAEHATMQ